MSSCIIPTIWIPGTSLGASITTTTEVRVYYSIYVTLCTEHFTCCIFGTTTAVTTVIRLAFRRGWCFYIGRWAFGCSDTVMVNMKNILYRGSENIVLGCWIDANDHMYIENLAVDDNQCPPFLSTFWGGCAPFCHPPWRKCTTAHVIPRILNVVNVVGHDLVMERYFPDTSLRDMRPHFVQ